MPFAPKPQNPKQASKIENPMMAKFFADGMAHITKAKETTGIDPCWAIKPGTEEWSSWKLYILKRLGVLPVVMKMVLDGRGIESFTVPAQWPEWFDPTYLEGHVPLEPKPMRRHIGDDERARMIEKWAKLRRELGA